MRSRYQSLPVVVSRCHFVSAARGNTYVSKNRALYYDRSTSMQLSMLLFISHQLIRYESRMAMLHTQVYSNISSSSKGAASPSLDLFFLYCPIQYSGTSVQGRDRLPNDEESIRGKFLPDSVKTPEGGAVFRHHRRMALANAERVAYESLEGWN